VTQSQPLETAAEIQEIKTTVAKLHKQRKEDMTEERELLVKNQEILKEIIEVMNEIKQEVERMEELKTQNTELLRRVDEQTSNSISAERDCQTKVTPNIPNNYNAATIYPLEKTQPTTLENGQKLPEKSTKKRRGSSRPKSTRQTGKRNDDRR
jgi:long-subunit acyl-CoA synthetase (AMP-forming)